MKIITVLLIALLFIYEKEEIEKKVVNEEMAIVNPNSNSHVIFYIPHQDDETLTFGVGIMNHIMNGHNIHVVLLTDGSASQVKTDLGMTDLEFTEARNREFAKAMNIYGVKPENIDYRNIKDGTLTVAKTESIIREYELKYPLAKHKAFSWTDSHVDHINSGQALKNLQTAGVLSDARYYVRRGTVAPVGITLTTEVYNPSHMPFYLAISASYKLVNDRLGFYGIGYKSVPASFDSYEEQPLSRYHK